MPFLSYVLGSGRSPYRKYTTRRGNMEEKRIEKLYEMLERAEKEKDTDAVAVLRWVIFNLEK